jgi:hypothetical protein
LVDDSEISLPLTTVKKTIQDLSIHWIMKK